MAREIFPKRFANWTSELLQPFDVSSHLTVILLLLGEKAGMRASLITAESARL
jgi:hypothetical protein